MVATVSGTTIVAITTGSEMRWNGTLLSSVHNVVGWGETMTWSGVHPATTLINTVYPSGVKLTKEAMKI